jgi:hypothetical protein
VSWPQNESKVEPLRTMSECVKTRSSNNNNNIKAKSLSSSCFFFFNMKIWWNIYFWNCHFRREMDTANYDIIWIRVGACTHRQHNSFEFHYFIMHKKKLWKKSFSKIKYEPSAVDMLFIIVCELRLGCDFVIIMSLI